MMIDVREGKLGPAIEAARREVTHGPNRAESHLQLGQLLAMTRMASTSEHDSTILEAEAELKRAAELGAKRHGCVVCAAGAVQWHWTDQGSSRIARQA